MLQGFGVVHPIPRHVGYGLNKPAPKSLRKKAQLTTGRQSGYEGKTLAPHPVVKMANTSFAANYSPRQ